MSMLRHINGTVGLGAIVSVVLVAGFWYWSGKSELVNDRPFVAEESIDNEVQWQVQWPEPYAELNSRQTFVLSFPGAAEVVPENYQVGWMVDGGVKRGSLDLVDGKFTTVVDVSDWDWSKSGQYNLSFSVNDIRQGSYSSRLVPVTLWTGVTEAGNDKVAVKNATTPQSALAGEEPAGNLLSDNVIETSPRPMVRGVKSFDVEWIPGTAAESQRFVYRVEGYPADSISVFWKSEGGHNNMVYPDARGVYESKININGWRWRGQGPYQIIFSVVDKRDNTILGTETYELNWQGDPGESTFALTAKGSGDGSSPVTGASTGQSSPSQAADRETVAATRTTPTVKVPSVGQVGRPSDRVETTNTLFLLRPVSALLSGETLTLLKTDKPAVRESQQNTSGKNLEALNYLLDQPAAIWLNGDGHDSDDQIKEFLAEARKQSAVPVFVLYNIPHRDCGSHSSGGAKSGDLYRAWVDRLAGLFKSERLVVVVEPDALAQLKCVPTNSQDERLRLVEYAVSTIAKSSPQSLIYIDAGHPFWVNVEEMSRRLKQAGVDVARGFSLNVSNFAATPDNITYGQRLSSLLGGKKFVIDTSRNGNGTAANREWCNPAGRALGAIPKISLSPGNLLDGYLWIKYPGESDGYCNGGPRAGAWWMEYAVALYNNRPL